jgi:small subunit ribosomal protein S17
MRQTFTGIVVSNKMSKTAVVNVVFTKAHPVYKKLVKKDRKIKADTGTNSVKVGERVKIVGTRPISKDKHFKIVEVVKNGSA